MTATGTVHHPIRFGLFLSQAGRSWPEVVDSFRLADDLGFDHAWLVDHLLDTDRAADTPCLEAWTSLAALATLTSRVELGVLVTNNLFRHPSILMKQAVTVDHVSGGRLILGLGTGWHEDEHSRYGIDFPPASERIERLEETVEIARTMVSTAWTTFHGRHYRLDDAALEPRPLRAAGIPLLIAAHRPRALRLAARHADIWDTFPNISGTATEGVDDDVAARAERIDGYCRDIGRDPRTLRRSIWVGREAAASPDAFAAFVEGYRAIGFTDFSVAPRLPDDTAAIRTIAAELLPDLRRA